MAQRLALFWGVAVAAGYDYGDRVRVSAKSRVGSAETEWSDVVFASSPRFRERSAPVLRGVPLAPGATTTGDDGFLRLSVPPADVGPWLPLRDSAGTRLSQVDVTLVHDGASVVEVAVAARYDRGDERKGGDPEPSRFLPQVRIAYDWRWRAKSDDFLARTLGLLSAVGLCVFFTYVN